MDTSYVAFGLALRSSFVLPGMEPGTAKGLPSLVLELAAPAEVELAWSGPRGALPWRGRLGDGQELTLEWGVDGDLLFTYGERAFFRLDSTRSRLECAPRDTASMDWQRVLLSRILPNVSLAHGREALHASAVESPLGVIAITAASGEGKSTLASELMRRGLPLFADDVLILTGESNRIEAYPGTPHMNLSDSVAGSTVEEFGATLGTFAGERWIAARNAARGAREVAAICVLEREPGLPLATEPLGSPLALAPYMLGLPDDDGRERSRFDLYSDLMHSAVVVRLTGDSADEPADFADMIERALDLSGSFAAREAV